MNKRTVFTILITLVTICLVNPAIAYYNPQQGRFLTQDPMGITPNSHSRNVFHATFQYYGLANKYEYTLSNPIFLVDSFGLWGESVHKTATEKWAKEVGYRSWCAKVIADADNAVDSVFSDTGPWPLIGDASYHFDTDPNGGDFVPGARMAHFRDHFKKAQDTVKSAVHLLRVRVGLKELGKALHPLQDIYSHNIRHKANHPMLHAPRMYCIALGDPMGKKNEFCIWQRESSENWKDPHTPDYEKKWQADYLATESVTRSKLKAFLDYDIVSCQCGN